MRVFHPEYNPLRLSYWFGQVDSRPLSVFRIVLGLLLLKDAVYHFFIAEAFYSDAGFVPRSALEQGLLRTYRFSIMDAFAHAWQAQLFFALWVVVLILFTVGYRTRLMTVLQFLIIVSVHERNIYVLNGADTVFRVLSFWSIFIDLGQYYSVDALRERFRRYGRTHQLADLRVETMPRTTYAFPVRMIQIQFALIYLFTAWLKLPGAAWRNGDAVYYALQLQSLTLPTGDLVFAYAPLWMLRLMTYQSLFAELVFFFFVFLPFGQPLLRGIALFLGFLLHFGIGVTMSIENFSMVMIGGYLLFFEPAWIEWVDRKLRRVLTPSTLPLPAGPSPLWVLLAGTRPDEIVAARGEARPEDTNPNGWWIFNEQGRRQIGGAAWARAAGHLPASWLWSWLMAIKPLRHAVWWPVRELVQRDPPPDPAPPQRPAALDETHPAPPRLARWQAAGALLAGIAAALLLVWIIVAPSGRGLQAESRIPIGWTIGFMIWPVLLIAGAAWAAVAALFDPVRRRVRAFSAAGRIAFTAVLAMLMAFLVWWNLTTVKNGDESITPAGVPEIPRRTIQLLGIWQAWDMFSPYPSTLDGWMVTPGQFEDGTSIDLRTGERLSLDFRRWYAGPGVRWKKYESNLSRNDYEPLLRAWGSYYCYRYNTEMKLPEGQRLATLEIHFYQIRSHAPGEPRSPIEDRMLWKHWCYPEYEY